MVQPDGVEFRVLGPMLVSRPGVSVALPRSGLLRGLLGMLLLADGEPLSTSRLAAAVWTGSAGPARKGTIQVGVSRLRAWLRSAGLAGAVSVEHVGPGYRLTMRSGAVDLALLRARVAAARDAGDLADRFRLLRPAMAMFRGPVLADLSTVDRTDPLVREADRTVCEGALALCAAAIAVGRPADALTPVEAVAAGAPFDEPVHAGLIDLLAAAERPAEALRHYERLRRGLADELGVSPSEEVQRAYLAVLGRDRQLDPPVQVPAQLPMAVAGFTGRTAELSTLDEIVVGGSGAAVAVGAVSGTAGVGKTALAVEWARLRHDWYPDGQLYVDLRGYDVDQPAVPADVLVGFLTALGVPEPDVPQDPDQRAARFRTATAGRRMLVLLDNASSVEQVRPLLPGHPSCAVIVTSRDSLAGLVAVHGARRLDLDLMPPHDAVALLRRLVGRRVDAEPAAATALADRCCRLPLALRVAAELAVAHPTTSLADLVADLADRQHRVDRLDAGGDPRGAVRAVFSWSVRHLSPDVARGFALLGLHPGPDTDRYAVAALAGLPPDRAAAVLDLLARAHLLHPTGPGRYGMHDLLRGYAAGVAAGDYPAEDVRAALGRLLDHYAAAAAAAIRALYQAEADHPERATPTPAPADPDAARRWLDVELPNLTAVAACAAAHGWPALTVGLSTVLYRYLVGGHRTEASTIHAHAREAARAAGDAAGEAHALLGLGTIGWQTGRLDRATDDLRRSLVLFRRIGDRVGQARALGHLGIVNWRMGRYPQAARYHRRAMVLFRAAGDRTAEGLALTNLGLVEERLGRYDAAADHHRQALALARAAGDSTGEATALSNLGVVEKQRGRNDRAAAHLEHALDLFRRTGNRFGEAGVLTALGSACTGLGRLDRAAQHHRQAADLFRHCGELAGQAEAHNGLGEVAYAASRIGEARDHHADALAVAVEAGSRDEQARAHTGLGRAFRRLDHVGQARSHYERAVTLYASLGSPLAGHVRDEIAALDVDAS
jgi:DNA-binding SARP family transcriptional activator/tetratricopeptide (TPR) repeat protein